MKVKFEAIIYREKSGVVIAKKSFDVEANDAGEWTQEAMFSAARAAFPDFELFDLDSDGGCGLYGSVDFDGRAEEYCVAGEPVDETE